MQGNPTSCFPPAVWLTAISLLYAACTPMFSTRDAGALDAGDSQERYTWPGCDDAGSYGCPRSRVFICALDSIQARHASCQTAADCVAVSTTNCFGYLTDCAPAAVNATSAAAFLAEANAEGARYCDGGHCGGSASCSSSYDLKLTDCLFGKCIPRSDDGGF